MSIFRLMEALKSYLQASSETQAQFAERVSIKQGTVSKLIGGHMLPSLRLARKIDVATGGKVPVSAWAQPLDFEPVTTPPAASAAPTQEQSHVSTPDE